MYLPLEYWRRLERHPGVKGSRDGKVVTFDNARRYFDNTTFAHLVASGWIGTTAPQTAILDDVIREILKTGRTVTIAVKRDLNPEEQSRRPSERSWRGRRKRNSSVSAPGFAGAAPRVTGKRPP